ncbi:uncharacterized protein LOC111378242 [Olea europaea var. sylvestris]|uniref:uncharacterized protein LOC111378242 n=1 Tax=Olea europaea var. sylvestris TaxID=158386 RepID=UPI000C1CE825|nr:uncharacterized protein LOC111378242 [Olea europaea var. sylvestris]XP_022857181.1 uncharacterized protein LOC111378242 [Olea europaea var. sylvestris]XP_022857182.1 uncharacterized protein LOC111378242 [Olea europaea var. sylvestris]XP_022857183.1 uncharacterized protein LOC111378242 [Olea europaea var. sylvestris]
MEFKGITWAGNIYQKFEAMCLEVEDVMVQDTVKYMENQVQKAGVSVKKFYSEVLQDLIPSSCAKVAADDLSMYPYSRTDINRKLKPCLTENWGEVKNKTTEDKVIHAMDTWKISPISGLEDVNHLSPLSSGFPVQNACSEVYSAKDKKMGIYKRRPIGIKRISEKNHLPKISEPMTPVSAEKNSSDVEASTELVSRERCDSGETVNMNTQIFDPPIESVASNTILSVDPVRRKDDDAQCISSCHDLPSESIGTSMNGGTGLQLGSNIQSHACSAESGGKEVTLSDEAARVNSYNIDMEVENAVLVEPGVDIIKRVTNTKLEESCILVEGNEIHVVPQGIGKHKSYKKKISEALSTKLGSRKKQEYAQCIPQSRYLGGTGSTEIVIPDRTPDFEEKKLPAQDFCESDWEFL